MNFRLFRRVFQSSLSLNTHEILLNDYVKLLTHLFPAADLDDLHLSYLQFFPNYQHRDEARFEASLSVDDPCKAVSIFSAFVPTRHFNVNYTTSSLAGC